jgi:hypothetical protein
VSWNSARQSRSARIKKNLSQTPLCRWAARSESKASQQSSFPHEQGAGALYPQSYDQIRRRLRDRPDRQKMIPVLYSVCNQHKDEVPRIPDFRTSEPQLGEGDRIGIIVYGNRQSGRLRNYFADRQVAPHKIRNEDRITCCRSNQSGRPRSGSGIPRRGDQAMTSLPSRFRKVGCMALDREINIVVEYREE